MKDKFTFDGRPDQYRDGDRVRSMTTIATQHRSQTDSPRGFIGVFHEISDFFRQFILAAFHPYRPEQHYMRGPGPACKAKRDPAAHRHLI